MHPTDFRHLPTMYRFDVGYSTFYDDNDGGDHVISVYVLTISVLQAYEEAIDVTRRRHENVRSIIITSIKYVR